MKYVKKRNMVVIGCTLLLGNPSGYASSTTDKHEIIKHTAEEVEGKAEVFRWVHAGIAGYCLAEALSPATFVVSLGVLGEGQTLSPCVYASGTANLLNNEISKSTLNDSLKKIQDELKKEAESQLRGSTGIRDQGYLQSIGKAVENQIGSYLAAGAHKVADATVKGETVDWKEVGSDTFNEKVKNSGGYANLAAGLLLPSERDVMTVKDGLKNAMSWVDKGTGFIPEAGLRAVRQAMVSASEFQLKAEWEEVKKEQGNTIGNLQQNIQQNNVTNNISGGSEFNKSVANNGSVTAKSESSSDPCATVANASQAVNCISSKNAAIARVLNDPKIAQEFKNKTGKDLKDFVGNMAMQFGNDPVSAIRGLGNVLAAGGMSGDQLNRANQFFGALADQLKSTIQEEQSKIASSKMSDKYKTTNQAGGIAGKGGAGGPAAGAGLPNLDIAGMFGDLFGKKPEDKKDARLGKLNFAAARKEKIPGYGADVWENREISIFERVENAYQVVTVAQGFDWNNWKLSSNQKASINAKGRMPASSQR